MKEGARANSLCIAVCLTDAKALLMDMQELLFDQSLLQMAQKMYRPASHYAPCSQPYQSPADISPLVHEQCHQEIARGKLDIKYSASYIG